MELNSDWTLKFSNFFHETLSILYKYQYEILDTSTIWQLFGENPT